jgi:anti-sigma regulatory factor (Ser/Thr protein kinase)
MFATDRPPRVGYIPHEAGRRLDQRVKEILARRDGGADPPARCGEGELVAEQPQPTGAQTAFLPRTGGPAAARETVTRWLDGHVSRDVLNDARMLVSELVTNSLVHADAPAGARVRIEVRLTAEKLRLAVGDRGDRGAVVRRPPDPDRGSGFGLNLVNSIATDWGVSHADGTTVWCELATRP